MLVLSRKTGQGVVLNENIEVVVIDVRGDRVRLGIVAPREIPVDRREVHEAKQRKLEQRTNGVGEAEAA